MNVSVELKIIIHLPVPAIGYMSAVTTYFSALNIHFSGITMDLGSHQTKNNGQGYAFNTFHGLSVHLKNKISVASFLPSRHCKLL